MVGVGWVCAVPINTRVLGSAEVLVAMERIRRDGEALQYASEELKRDREVVNEADWQNGPVLRFASVELKRDREVAIEAVRQSGDAPRCTLI